METAGSCPDRLDRENKAWRKVKAEIDAAQFLNSIEPINPDRGFLEKVLGLFILPEEIFLILVPSSRTMR